MADWASRQGSVAMREPSPKLVEETTSEHALVADVGVTRFFGIADIRRQGLLEGWSSSEEGHNWNDGKDAKLAICLRPAPTAPCTLTVEGSPYLPEGINRQRVTLYGNGFRLGYWNLQEQKTYILKADIEPEQWFIRDGGALLRMVWHMPDSLKPADIGTTADQRELGFCFRTITVHLELR